MQLNEFLARRRPNWLLFSLVLPVISGILMGWPWLDERAFPASWLGLTIMLTITWQLPAYLSFRRWLLAGVVTVGLALYWFPLMAANSLRVSLLTGFMAIAFLILWDAFRFGIFGYLIRWLDVNVRWACLGVPIIWTGLEYIWPHVFPWRLGHTQMGWLAVMQSAELAGVYGVSFLVIWVTATLGGWLSRRGNPDPQPRKKARSNAIAAALTLTTAVIWGNSQMGSIEEAIKPAPQLRVAAIQPGSLGSRMRPTLRERSADLPEDIDLVVWPESSAESYPMRLTSFASQQQVHEMTRIAGDVRPMPGLGKPLLCVGRSYDEDSELRHSTAFLVADDERILGHYHKRFLMPWGEYVVGQNWIPGLEALLGGSSGYRAGTSAAPLRLTGGAALGVMICYDDLLAEAARESVREGAQLLINCNNLAAFSEAPTLWQHQKIARARAIETRRWLMRCGVTGSTAAISPTGRVAHQAKPHQPATLVADVRLLDSQTLYVRVGDLLGWGALLVTSLLVLLKLVHIFTPRPAAKK